MTVEHSNTENTTALRIYYCGREQCAPGHFWGPAIRPHYLLHVVLHGPHPESHSCNPPFLIWPSHSVPPVFLFGA